MGGREVWFCSGSSYNWWRWWWLEPAPLHHASLHYSLSSPVMPPTSVTMLQRIPDLSPTAAAVWQRNNVTSGVMDQWEYEHNSVLTFLPLTQYPWYWVAWSLYIVTIKWSYIWLQTSFQLGLINNFSILYFLKVLVFYRYNYCQGVLCDIF